MKLYRINTGDGVHFARSKEHLKRAMTELEKDAVFPREEFEVDVVHFDISVQGILNALYHGCEAANENEDGRFCIFGHDR